MSTKAMQDLLDEYLGSPTEPSPDYHPSQASMKIQKFEEEISGLSPYLEGQKQLSSTNTSTEKH